MAIPKAEFKTCFIRKSYTEYSEKIDSGELQFPENSIEGYISQLKKYDFIHPDLVSAYFIRKEDLPTQQSIGEKYGLSKSGITKKLERFLNDMPSK